MIHDAYELSIYSPQHLSFYYYRKWVKYWFSVAIHSSPASSSSSFSALFSFSKINSISNHPIIHEIVPDVSKTWRHPEISYIQWIHETWIDHVIEIIIVSIPTYLLNRIFNKNTFTHLFLWFLIVYISQCHLFFSSNYAHFIKLLPLARFKNEDHYYYLLFLLCWTPFDQYTFFENFWDDETVQRNESYTKCYVCIHFEMEMRWSLSFDMCCIQRAFKVFEHHIAHQFARYHDLYVR